MDFHELRPTTVNGSTLVPVHAVLRAPCAPVRRAEDAHAWTGCDCDDEWNECLRAAWDLAAAHWALDQAREALREGMRRRNEAKAAWDEAKADVREAEQNCRSTHSTMWAEWGDVLAAEAIAAAACAAVVPACRVPGTILCRSAQAACAGALWFLARETLEHNNARFLWEQATRRYWDFVGIERAAHRLYLQRVAALDPLMEDVEAKEADVAAKKAAHDAAVLKYNQWKAACP